MIINTGFVDFDTPTGPMRTHVYAPAPPTGTARYPGLLLYPEIYQQTGLSQQLAGHGYVVMAPPTGTARYPGLLLYPEIYQQTGPIVRLSQQLAGHGYVVMAPEIYHEHEPPGTVLAYDKAGTDKGNAYKAATTLATFDHDAAVVIRALGAHPACNGRIGAVGVCLGGHLAFRAALQPQVLAATCFYATDLQGGILAGGTCVDTLARARDIRGELLLVWGRQDPHVPDGARAGIYQALVAAGTTFTWHEFNAQHAFMRDEGPRYDAEAARIALGLALSLFQRTL